MSADKMISQADMVGWRLHWVMCDLDTLYDTIVRRNITRTAGGKEYYLLYGESIDEFGAKLKEIAGRVSRIEWEAGTMFGEDAWDARPVVEEHEKFAAVKARVAKIDAELNKMFDNYIDMARSHLINRHRAHRLS